MPKPVVLLALISAIALGACNSPQTESLYNILHMGPKKPLAKARPPARLPLIVRRYNRPNDLGISPYLFHQRKMMIAGEAIPDEDLKALANTGDGYAAWTYAERLNAREDPALTMTTIDYYARAAEAGRAGGVPRIIELMNTEAFETASDPQLDRLERLLRDFALKKRDTQAALYLVQRYNLGTPFGDKSEDVVPLLETLAEGGDERIALQLATQILQTRELADDPDQRETARRYLGIAAQADNISIQTTAQNLLKLMDRKDNSNSVPVAPQVPTVERIAAPPPRPGNLGPFGPENEETAL